MEFEIHVKSSHKNITNGKCRWIHHSLFYNTLGFKKIQKYLKMVANEHNAIKRSFEA